MRLQPSRPRPFATQLRLSKVNADENRPSIKLSIIKNPPAPKGDASRVNNTTDDDEPAHPTENAGSASVGRPPWDLPGPLRFSQSSEQYQRRVLLARLFERLRLLPGCGRRSCCCRSLVVGKVAVVPIAEDRCRSWRAKTGRPYKVTVVDLAVWDDLFAMFLAPRHPGRRQKV